MLLKHHVHVHQVQQELRVLHDFVPIIYLEQVQQFQLFDHYLIVNMLQVPNRKSEMIDFYFSDSFILLVVLRQSIDEYVLSNSTLKQLTQLVPSMIEPKQHDVSFDNQPLIPQ